MILACFHYFQIVLHELVERFSVLIICYRQYWTSVGEGSSVTVGDLF